MKKYLLLLSIFVLPQPFLAMDIDVPAASPSALLGLPGFTLQFDAPPQAQEIYSLWGSGEEKQAFKSLLKWKKEDKKSPYVWVVGASLYYQKEQYKKCLKWAKKAIKLKPQMAEAYFWKGKAFEATDKPLEAANEYRAALFANKEYSLAQQGLARVTASLGIVNLDESENAEN